MKNILIRCDASKDIGLGHITRCLVLANKFRNDGHHVYFAIKNYEIAIEKLNEQKFDVLIAIDGFDYFNWIESIVEEKQINIFIGDIRDGFPIELITFMKKRNILTVAIDEPSSYAKECDLCFYPPHAIIDESEYKGKVYQGLEYVILRDEFYEKFEKTKNEIPNILVMMGGTDAYNLTLPVIKKLDSCNEKFMISVILSDNHKDIKVLNDFIKISNHKIDIYNKVDNMSSFLNNIDFAIVQFGTILYELIVKKVFTLVYINFQNEIYFKFFNQQGVIFINEFNINELFIIRNIPKNKKFTNKVVEKIKLNLKEGIYESLERT